MSSEIPDQASLEAVAKHISDAQDLVTLLLQSLSRATPWQRQLAAHLTDIEQQMQVLRMTVVLEKQDAEILVAAKHLAASCRLATTALAGSRVDRNTRAAVHLLNSLTVRIQTLLVAAQR